VSPSQPWGPKALLRLAVWQVVGVGLFGLGFWLLYLAFLRGNVLSGVVGGVLLLAGMWAMTRSRRAAGGGKR